LLGIADTQLIRCPTLLSARLVPEKPTDRRQDLGHDSPNQWGRTSGPNSTLVFGLDDHRLEKVDLTALKGTINSMEQLACLQSRPVFSLDTNSFATQGHPVVNRIPRDYSSLAGLKYDLAIADQEACATSDDLESFLLKRMNVPILAPQPEIRVLERFAHCVHRKYLAVRAILSPARTMIADLCYVWQKAFKRVAKRTTERGAQGVGFIDLFGGQYNTHQDLPFLAMM
jgi:hypothetical protein